MNFLQLVQLILFVHHRSKCCHRLSEGIDREHFVQVKVGHIELFIKSVVIFTEHVELVLNCLEGRIGRDVCALEKLDLIMDESCECLRLVFDVHTERFSNRKLVLFHPTDCRTKFFTFRNLDRQMSHVPDEIFFSSLNVHQVSFSLCCYSVNDAAVFFLEVVGGFACNPGVFFASLKLYLEAFKPVGDRPNSSLCCCLNVIRKLLKSVHP